MQAFGELVTSLLMNRCSYEVILTDKLNRRVSIRVSFQLHQDWVYLLSRDIRVCFAFACVTNTAVASTLPLEH